MKNNKISEAKRGKNNPIWKGDKAGYNAIHAYVRRRKEKPEKCEKCKERPAMDLANISQEYKRDLSDWEYLCRKCHMDKDGRNDQLRINGKSRKLPEKKCLTCEKMFHRDNKNAKYCTQKCYEKSKKGRAVTKETRKKISNSVKKVWAERKKTKPRKYFIITDTHFFHDMMCEYCNRPKNFNDLIITNWNKLVSEDDIVFHLGDVIFSKVSELSDIMHKLKGIKILIRGNHDKKSPSWFMNNGFAFCCDGFKFNNIYLSHIPQASLPDNCDVNVHGHYHNSDERHHECERKDFHRLLHIEDNFCPILLDQFLSK